MLGSLVSLGPLACFSIITRYPKILEIFLHIIGVLKAKYTAVYIITLFLVGVVPLFHSIVSVPFSPVLVFLIRLIGLLYLYNKEFYLLLKDLMCCKVEYARQLGEKALKIGVLAWGGSKVFPHGRDLFEDVTQRLGDRADAKHATAEVENRFREGAITQAQREKATVSILDNLINRKGDRITKIKGPGFSSVTTTKHKQ
jgi:hypothetical protein